MTKDDHLKLYDEVKAVILTRGLSTSNLTPAQRFFVEALEEAAFGTDFLRCYSRIIDKHPDINVRNLHALCLGFALGSNPAISELNYNNTYH